MIQGRTMTPHKSNLSIDAWLTRLGRVLAQDTGNQPVIRRVPSNASDTEKDLIWWVSDDPTSVFIGVNAEDAETLRRTRQQVLAGEGRDLATLAFSDLLNRSMGPGDVAPGAPPASAKREVYKVEFPTGQGINLFVAEIESDRHDTTNLDMLMDIELPISLRFGSTKMPLRDIAGLGSGSVIELDRSINDPVEVIVNGHVVARGEAVIVRGAYGVRISEISSRREHLLSSAFTAAPGARQPVAGQIV
jgi:flagellar motor switch protein FliN